MTQSEQLDATLIYLKERKDEFVPAKTFLNTLGLEEQFAQCIIESLHQNGHIELRANVTQYADMKITPEGIDFITRSTYVDNLDSGLVRLSSFKGVSGKGEKEVLEMRQLKLNVQALQTQVSDYPKVRREARLAIILAGLAVLAAIAEAALLLHQQGLF